MPIRGTLRGSFRGRGGNARSRGTFPPRNYPVMPVNGNMFDQFGVPPNGQFTVADMDFTTDDFSTHSTDPNTNSSWDNISDRKRTKPIEYDGPAKKACSQGPQPGPFAGFPPRPLLPRPMGQPPFGRPPRPPMPPNHNMGPPFPPRFFGPGPGPRGPPPPMPRGPTRFIPPPFTRPGPPMRPMGFRPLGPMRGFPSGVRAPPGVRGGRGAFGGGPRMFRQ